MTNSPTNLENAERADMELLPCPFCGGSEIYMEPDERGSGGQWVYPIHVGCSACGVDITCSDAETEDEAAEVWNRRADRSAVGVKALEPVAWRYRDSEDEPWQCEHWDYLSESAKAEMRSKHKIVEPLCRAALRAGEEGK